jgi:hypothetical protein
LMPPGLFGSTTIDCSACMEKANTQATVDATGVEVRVSAFRARRSCRGQQPKALPVVPGSRQRGFWDSDTYLCTLPLHRLLLRDYRKLPRKNRACGKEKPQAVYTLGVRGVCCLNLGSLRPGGRVSGDGEPPGRPIS